MRTVKYRNTPEKSISKGCMRSLSQVKTMWNPSSTFADTWYVPGASLMPAAHPTSRPPGYHERREQTATSQAAPWQSPQVPPPSLTARTAVWPTLQWAIGTAAAGSFWAMQRTGSLR